MKIRDTFWLAFLTIVLAVPTAVPATEMGTQGVSPGALDRMALVGTACPTFSWEVNLEADHYELLVYQLGTDSADLAEIDLATATEVLFTTVPGRANSWTPELEDCFSSGGRYVWFIRAAGEFHTGTAGEWSKPRLFEIAGTPSQQQVREAIEVLARYVESDEAGVDLGTLLAESFEPVARDESDHMPSTQKTTLAGDRSVISGVAAIRGEQPDFSGETFGVVGLNASPDGAGVGAANIAGGPDLVLDGAVPAEFSESGVDRPSGAAQTFNIRNSVGGGMSLQVDGVDVVTTLTDQDSLASLSCSSEEIAKWNGSTWACASDDDTPYTPGVGSIGSAEVLDDSLTANDLATNSVGVLELNTGEIFEPARNVFNASHLEVSTIYTTGVTIASQSVDFPTAGTALVLASCIYYCNNCSETNLQVAGFVSIMTTPTGSVFDGDEIYVRMVFNPNLRVEHDSMALHDVFSVDPGVTTFYLRAGVHSTDYSFEVGDVSMSVVFFPN